MKSEIRMLALELSPLRDQTLFQFYYDIQPRWRQEKIDTLRRLPDKIQSLGAGILLQKALPGADLTQIRFGENGKPYLPGYEMQFNLSHAGDWALCAVGNAALGCDIEQMRSYKMSMAHRFFCAEETRMLEDAEGEIQQDLFFRLWTLKESFLKAVGEGLSKPLNSFCISFENSDPVLTGLENEWLLREYKAAAGYRCALCAAAGSVPPKEVEIVSCILLPNSELRTPNSKA